MIFFEPSEREARPAWSDVPAAIVGQLEALLLEKIISAEIVWGGYSPSAVFAATLESGRKVFIKGTHPGQDAHGTQMLRQEIEAYRVIPGLAAHAPAFIGMVSDGLEDGWMLAVFEYIDKAPTLPWTIEKLEKIFTLLRVFHFCEDGRMPTALPWAHEKNYVEKYLRPQSGWFRIRDNPEITAKFLTLFEDAEAGELWLSVALSKLCAQQEKVMEMKSPVGIIHQDLRSDNILFDPKGRVYLVDWPNACRGPVVMDIVYFLSTISAESGFDAEILLGLYEKTTGIKLDRTALATALASSSGHVADSAYRAVPLKLPRLRWIQKVTLWSMLQWGVVLLNIPQPPRFKI